jgi:hypothetical protein
MKSEFSAAGPKLSLTGNAYMVPMLKDYFQGKALREISAQSIAKFKKDRIRSG